MIEFIYLNLIRYASDLSCFDDVGFCECIMHTDVFHEKSTIVSKLIDRTVAILSFYSSDNFFKLIEGLLNRVSQRGAFDCTFEVV